MILLRTTEFNELTAEFAQTLSEASGRRVAILADERARTVHTGEIAKVSINEAECQAIGLYTPDDFTWRCGDYGFYLARRLFPEEKSFWIIENDVQISAPETFFRCTDAFPNIDLLSAYLKPATSDWWWYGSAASCNAMPYRCLFPVVRLSVQAIDCLERIRVAQSHCIFRRMLWPNDETFVATSLVHAKLKVADLNSLGQVFYDEQSYAFDLVIDGDLLVLSGTTPRLYHSVLRGKALELKRGRVRNFARPKPLSERFIRKSVPQVNMLFRW